MTLEELKTRCEEQGFQYAYGKFEEVIEPPHLVAICRDTDNFMADNRVYSKNIPIQLDYTYIRKNIEEQIERHRKKPMPYFNMIRKIWYFIARCFQMHLSHVQC